MCVWHQSSSVVDFAQEHKQLTLHRPTKRKPLAAPAFLVFPFRFIVDDGKLLSCGCARPPITRSSGRLRASQSRGRLLLARNSCRQQLWSLCSRQHLAAQLTSHKLGESFADTCAGLGGREVVRCADARAVEKYFVLVHVSATTMRRSGSRRRRHARSSPSLPALFHVALVSLHTAGKAVGERYRGRKGERKLTAMAMQSSSESILRNSFTQSLTRVKEASSVMS